MFSRFLSRAHSFSPVVYLNADNGASGGGSAEGSENGNPVVPPKQSNQQPDFKALAQAVVAEVLAAQSVKGDQGKALEVLAGRNARLEQALNDRTQEVGALKSQIPDTKQVSADAAELEGWRKAAEQSGIKKPEEIQSLVTERDDYKGREESRAKTDLRNQAAKAAGYDPDKFDALKDVDKWAYEVKTEKVDGKDIEVAYVVQKDDKGTETRKPLSEAVAAAFPALADSIKADGGQQQARHVSQGSSGTSAAGGIYDRIRQDAAEKDKAKAETGPSLEQRLNMPTK